MNAFTPCVSVRVAILTHPIHLHTHIHSVKPVPNRNSRSIGGLTADVNARMSLQLDMLTSRNNGPAIPAYATGRRGTIAPSMLQRRATMGSAAAASLAAFQAGASSYGEEEKQEFESTFAEMTAAMGL